ncbi:ATP-binding protein [Corallococcus sp. BB11-1]|uniref:ATP-binding protein n=1 Tax=Corallococcus sp. BB11-1 TaxID=2996783 RepID=UPI0010E5139C|nr:ATP-binding protein [Corallococcus sp. BB11-1]MCY1037063.1 ATP-binding protein [Corallococcus sp. BB11-1]RYZ17744.1 MAG: AAA family ATPase [Myxococcaceae bacterium]
MSKPRSPRRICLVGVRGVGKTTLIRSILPALPQVDYVVGSAILRELAGADFARFDSLPPDVKQHYREEAIRWMETRQEGTGRDILCDGHTTLLNPATAQVEQVFTELDCHFFRELILLEGPPEVILQRRRDDLTKRRNLDGSLLHAELAGEREACLRIAREHDMRLHELPMGDDQVIARQLTGLLT